MGELRTLTAMVLAGLLAATGCNATSPGGSPPLLAACPDGGACADEPDASDAAMDVGPGLTPPPDVIQDDDAGQADSGPPPVVDEDRCPPSAIIDEGCMDLGGESEGSAGLCDGLDNDCNGAVDEACPCEAGTVQECFLGPPGRASTGACSMGRQTCIGIAEFEGWGPCQGGTLPSVEQCDSLDNDCNGCTDEIEGCEPTIDCPGPGDPRVPVGTPFATYTLDAADFYRGGEATAYRWRVGGSGCDQMFLGIDGSSASQTNGQLSYQVMGQGRQQMGVQFTLSGEYPVTLEVDQRDGETLSCSFPVTVGAGGLRVELCWEETGPTSRNNPVDLDLRMGLHGHTVDWMGTSDCSRTTCVPGMTSGPPFGHVKTWDTTACVAGIDVGLDQVWELLGYCWNPRLDLDNINETDVYRAENINLDFPRDDETFRVAVQHRSVAGIEAHPLVNVYCGGKLAGSFGGPDAPLEGFGVEGESQELWRVADVQMQVDGSGRTTGCSLQPLYPEGETTGFRITTSDLSF